MALKKSDIPTSLSTDERYYLESIEAELDKMLFHKFDGSNPVKFESFCHAECVTDTIAAELKCRYEDAGWQVTFHPDYENPEWCWFELK
jgi:hypothetical protein